MNASRWRMLCLLATIAALFLAVLAVEHLAPRAGSEGPSPADAVQQACDTILHWHAILKALQSGSFENPAKAA